MKVTFDLFVKLIYFDINLISKCLSIFYRVHCHIEYNISSGYRLSKDYRLYLEDVIIEQS